MSILFFLRNKIKKGSFLKSLGGLELWLDANDQLSIIKPNNLVEKWFDKSGRNNHASQLNVLDRPLFDPTFRQNKGGVKFDGISSGNYMDIPSLLIELKYTVFFVFFNIDQNSPNSDFKPILDTTGGDAYSGYDKGYSWARKGENDNSLSVGGVVQSGNIQTDEEAFTVITGWGDGSNNFIQNNNDTPLQRAYVQSSTFNTGYSLGADSGVNSRRLKGTVAEIIVFKRNLIENEIQTVKDYLFSKWALEDNYYVDENEDNYRDDASNYYVF